MSAHSTTPGAASGAPTTAPSPAAGAASGAATPAIDDATTAASVRDRDGLLARYLDVLDGERNLSRFTLRNYGTDLRHYFLWLEENSLELTAISRQLFRGYIGAMQAAGVSDRSVVRRVSTVKSLYRWMRLNDLMSGDPLVLVRGPKQARRLPHVLTLADITNLIAAADGATPGGLRDRALMEVLYGCGVRVSEASGLDVDDVDLYQLTMRVRGKGNKERLAVMGEPARGAIARWLRDGRRILADAGRQNVTEAGDWKLETGLDQSSFQSPVSSFSRDLAHSSPGTPLFLNKSGGRLSQRAMQILVRKYAKKAGIDARVHPHLLRHTFATHLLDGGAELRVVQELLGHSNPNTTQIYLHVTEERQRKVMDASMDELAQVEAARRALGRSRG